ncbi:MAG: 50S ribosomal protein L11 methyltransferase [Myxococcales bacterium]|nr:50S ribosomal protein L11 methyltransferase [Myxococcales bacterium]
MASSLFCIEVTLDHADADREEWVEAALWELEVPGVERQDDTTFSTLVEDPRPRAPGSVRWRVYLEDADDEAVVPFAEAIGDAARVETFRLTDLTFLTAWREFFRPSRVSRRVIVHPPWDVPAADDAVLVEIEPGMAFGTGTHETTRLCIVALDDGLAAGASSMLDVGCGSGVLAIAGAKLGAPRVVAIDNDLDAVAIAAENCDRNGVSVEVSGTDVAELDEEFDLVVANILPHVLIDLSDALLARMAKTARLVLSGIVNEQAERVREHFEGAGLRGTRTLVQGDWSMLEFVRE